MSITVHGFGTSLLTTVGWGGFGEALPDLPPLCPEIVDSFKLVPEVAASSRDDHLPTVNSLALKPQLAGSAREDRPSITSGEKLVPKIKDTESCN